MELWLMILLGLYALVAVALFAALVHKNSSDNGLFFSGATVVFFFVSILWPIWITYYVFANYLSRPR